MKIPIRKTPSWLVSLFAGGLGSRHLTKEILDQYSKFKEKYKALKSELSDPTHPNNNI